jgi:restriction endonuclease S subunit
VAYKGIIKPAVASSMFIVLRIENTKQLLPEFLAWFVNNPNTQTILSGNAKGTALPSINKDDVGSLEISIPPLKHQESILKIQSLRKQEISIKKQMDDLREQYIQQIILNTIDK